MSASSIGEVDLHAYVDGQLDAASRAEVEAYLAAHPEAARLVQELRAQNQALHAAYDGVMNEPIPLRLTNVLRPRPWSRNLVAGMAWLVCGLTIGWFVHPMLSSSNMPPPMAFAKEAMAAHVLYAAEKRHPVEVTAEQEAHLVAWLSKRLDAPIHAPDLRPQGFSLLGGRLLPGNAGPLAQLMYEAANGERLTLTVQHALDGQETGFKVMEKSGTSVFYWIDRDYGYALSGSIDKGRLLNVAQAVDAQLRSEKE